MSEERFECQKLESILVDYRAVLEDTEVYLKNLSGRILRDDDFLLETLLQIYHNRVRLMKLGLEKPYFARIDFQPKNEDKVSSYYIGKVGVTGFDNQIVTIDWRAPIATLYYDSNLGNVSYEGPDEVIEGVLCKKRQIDISKGKLERIQDVDTVSNDDILKPYLGVTAEHRLKNIVATIQTEQNRIIREKFQNMIVQGVAGSGKTTVALHRIAYLVYNYKEEINPNQYIVLAPNRFFLDYISNVLPDLDTSTVVQTTYDLFVEKYIGEKVHLESQVDEVQDFEACKFKNSLKYKELLDKFLVDLEKNILPNKDLIVCDIVIFTKEQIKSFYKQTQSKVYPTVKVRIEKTMLLMETFLSRDEPSRSRIYEKTLERPKEIKDKIKAELKSNFRKAIKQYFNGILTKKITSVYLEFMNQMVNYQTEDNQKVLERIQFLWEKRKKLKKVDEADLTALSYLYFYFYGAYDYDHYRHMVIDEAQDYGEFTFYLLKEILRKCTFSIYGDIAQSIYQYKGVSHWETVEQVFEGDIEVRKLLKSYRTTIEVMEEANKVIRHLGLSTAVPVIRHGQPVVYHKEESYHRDKIRNYVESYLAEGHEAIAVITKTEMEAKRVFADLEKSELEVELIVSADSRYHGGICVIPAYLAKGLEFDAVLICDASEEVYSSQDSNEMKLLYVAMTRALHQMDILYYGQLTKPLM